MMGFLLASGLVSAWGAPEQGVVIPNTALMEYTSHESYPWGGASNEVDAHVSLTKATDFTLTDDRSYRVISGLPVLLPHTLTNTGSTPESYKLEFKVLDGSDYDLSHLKIVIDQNNNGVADPGEPTYFDGDSVSLAPGESLIFSISGTVPANLNDELQARVQVTATAASSQNRLINIDTITVYTVPLAGNTLLSLAKKASRDVAEAGDSIVYTLELHNLLNAPLNQVNLQDVLPAYFTYEPGSARLDGVPLADPHGGRGPQLLFLLGDLAPLAKHTLLYRVRIERGVRPGESINTAQARTTAGVQAQSNVAKARVAIDDGVFTDKGVIIGKIFVDTNRSRVQDEGESGVPGVRVYLEDGTFAISDSEGKYSFYGVRPIAHVLKLDRTTLPAGASLLIVDTRNAGDAGSRFVDMKKAELHKADFAIEGGDPAVMDEVNLRRAKGEVDVAEIDSALRDRLDAESRDPALADLRARPASGLVGQGSAGMTDGGVAAGLRSTFTALLPTGTLNSENSNLAPAPVRAAATVPLEQFAEGVDNTPGFIGLADGSNVAGRQIAVRIKGPIGSQFSLWLNQAEVSTKRVGKRLIDPLRQLEAWEYIGVDLQAGENTLELVVHDPFGNERARMPVRITAPDRLAKIELGFSNSEPAADGHTPVRMTVRLVDQAGTPVTSRTPITLESDLVRWQVADLNATESGVQVFVEGGRADFTLLPPDSPGDAQIAVSSGAIKTAVSLPFLPDLRPMIASGVVEGTLFLRNGSSSGLVPSGAADAFEEELRELSRSGDLRTSGRTAFFLKGKIKGDMLLTAAYDSDKRSRERLFRDIEPDKYYPVYGDSSIRGYDAQSSRPLYVRIDRRRSYLLIGDFETRTEGEQNALGNYQRSLNGVRAHVENQRVRADAWASRDTTVQVVQEIPADGTSGPYRFRAANGLINSERVEILTRDRNQTSVVLNVEAQLRNTDYDFEPFTGRLLFTNPVRSMDANLNPRSIRITYEVDQGGDPFWVYGGNAQVRVTDRLEVGGTIARDENPLDQQTLGSANATVRLAANTFVVGEVAQSTTDLKGSGLAGRVDLRHQDEKTDARIYYSETDRDFVNPGALLTAGRIESGLKATRRLDEKNSVVVQGLITEDTATPAGERRKGVRADLVHAFEHGVKGEVGARWSNETNRSSGGTYDQPLPDGTPFEVRSLRFKLSTPVPHARNLSVFGEYEQDVVETDQRMAALGGEWQFSDRGRVYARHEFISSIGGPFELNQTQQNNITLLGVETDYLRDGKFFNEYRARDAFNGREAEASTGVRHQFQLSPGLRLQAGVERVTPFDGTTQNESTAVTTGVEYTDNPLWKGTARLEFRFADQNDSYLNTLGYARKLSRDWTFLGKSILYDVNQKSVGARDSLQARVLSGFAWRQTSADHWNALSSYEYRFEDGSSFDPTLDQLRNVHIVSVSVNYQPTRDWIFSSRYAFKLVDETVLGHAANYAGQQINFRALLEISKRWDAGLSASIGWSRGFDRHDWALGPEVGYNFHTNLRLGVGYNVVGFNDRDLNGSIPTQQGFFINLRLKFDEGLLGLFGASEPSANAKDKL